MVVHGVMTRNRNRTCYHFWEMRNEGKHDRQSSAHTFLHLITLWSCRTVNVSLPSAWKSLQLLHSNFHVVGKQWAVWIKTFALISNSKSLAQCGDNSGVPNESESDCHRTQIRVNYVSFLNAIQYIHINGNLLILMFLFTRHTQLIKMGCPLNTL